MTEPNYYEVLHVQPDASTAEIRRAYRARMLEVHPDKPGSGDGELARAVDEARTVLLDPVARARYDARRASSDLVDEAVQALADVGSRAIDRLTVTVHARSHDMLGVLRTKAADSLRRRRR